MPQRDSLPGLTVDKNGTAFSAHGEESIVALFHDSANREERFGYIHYLKHHAHGILVRRVSLSKFQQAMPLT